MIDRPLKYLAGVGAIVAVSTVLTACGTPQSSSPTAGAAPTSIAATSIPPTAVVAQAAPTVATAPTSTAAASTAAAAPTARPTQSATAAPTRAPTTQPSPTVSATSNAQAHAAGDVIRLVLDPASSQASYHAREVLVGHTLATDAVGTSPGVTGTLVLGLDGSVAADQSSITVDLTKLTSDESRRDNFTKRNTLQTDQFPTATFVPQEIQGLTMPLPTSGEATFQLLGDLTVHGVTKPVTWDVTAQFADATVTGDATTSVKLTDFGMTPPQVGPVLSIEDGLNLELAFTANRAG